MLGTAPMALSTAFSPPFTQLAPFLPRPSIATLPFHTNTGVSLQSPTSHPASCSTRNRPLLRSSTPTSFSAAGTETEEADFWMFGAWVALITGLESKLLSLHERLARTRFERIAVAGAVLGLLTAVLRLAVSVTASVFGAIARLGGADTDHSAAVEEEDLAVPVGEVPALRELTSEHLAATKFGGHRASKREVEAMGVVLERALALSEGERETMDKAWVDALTPTDFLRYVRGNGGEGRRAAEKLVATAVWRKEYGVSNILQDKETKIDNFFEGKVHEVDWLEEGADLESGRPTLLYRSAVHHPSDIPTDRWVRFFVHQCEWARVHYPNDQVLVLVDRVGSGLSNQDPTVLRALAPVIVDHYPDTIGRVLIAPVNNVLYVIWGLVSLILDPTTKSRMKLVKGNDWKDRLVRYMDAEKIPVRLGGTNQVL
uniref:CRAL-TRIO domain-containing protein n=2 Tax=Hemiselmis andersenii TaxID=464988 RepID=A0A7S0UCZ2_HEMAN|mmetsp:Transcript_777/g.1837  ORF Transcript_777/g.1837 Transcript_777/m.1837 type:complete len:429 (+) Transcript_777:116-1402(+)